jgi:EAL domain-containing protein (putative c-di-GMP-specific phosphodiesterase class I)
MYSAKDSGRNRYSYYKEELSQKANRLVAVEMALRGAIARQEFSLFYQPIIDTRKRRVSKVEALIRWHNSALGSIYPDEFIPIAEEFGQIVAIGEWVLEQACRAVQRFEQENCGLNSISINVSSVEFRTGDLGKRFNRIIDRHDVRPEQIDLEITEGYMLDRDQYCEEELRELRDLGHTICVDDFGTGYSSLNYMKRLPLNIIKIDRSFIKNIPADINDVKISEAIISLSNSLGYEVVAEGVETAEQFEYLLRKSCAFVQGYYFSEPVAAEDLPRRISEINESLQIAATATATAPTMRNVLA